MALVVIDGIGRMECMSPAFVEAVIRVLDSPVPVLATVAAEGGGLMAKVKARPDVEIVTITTANRDTSRINWLAASHRNERR